MKISQKSYDGKPTLYLIPTPIGNMEDITYRAVEILKKVDVVFSEDTRVTQLLLKKFDIKKKTISSHKFNESENKEKMLEYLKSGKDVGVVSDRGTPGISDPGIILANHAIANEYNVVGLPGPTALIPALIVSGINIDKFLFFGFLDSKESKRKKQLEELIKYDVSLVFYEAPHRIEKTLQNINDILGNRTISISREISKKFEEIYRGKVLEILPYMKNVKGELVVVVEGEKTVNDYNNLTVTEHVNMYIKENKTPTDAIKLAARDRNVSRKEIYNIYHNIK